MDIRIHILRRDTKIYIQCIIYTFTYVMLYILCYNNLLICIIFICQMGEGRDNVDSGRPGSTSEPVYDEKSGMFTLRRQKEHSSSATNIAGKE